MTIQKTHSLETVGGVSLAGGGVLIAPLQPTLQPVVHRVGHGVVGRRLDARLHLLRDGVPQCFAGRHRA